MGGAKADRRKFIKVAGLAGAGVIAAPNVSRAQTVSWKFQSTWPTKDIFHEFAQDYAKRVNEMSGGRMRLEVLAAGSVVPAFQMQDAVNAGILDGEQGVLAVRHPAGLRLGRQQLPRLDELRRRL
jgi:TRAP-type mannitol/chloroaromatic compound transport system substrate-binding protein